MTNNATPTAQSGNPLATQDQYEIEATAIKLLKRDDVQNAKEQARLSLRTDPKANTQAGLATLEQALEEGAQALLYDVILRDTSRPRIGITANAAHSWFGHHVHGARYGIDNPDTIYRYAVLDPKGHYRLTGQPAAGKLPSQYTFLMYENFRAGAVVPGLPQDPPSNAPPPENDAYTVGLFDQDIEKAADGSFVLTLSQNTNQEQRNHIQFNEFCTTLFMRQAIPNWQNQTALKLTLERLDAHETPAKSDDQLAEAFVARIQPHIHFWAQAANLYLYRTAANTLPVPVSRGGAWGYATLGNFELKEDEALIVTIDSKGADYTGFILVDPWAISREHISQSASLNNTQSHVNGDGSMTYVIAATDPEIQNWLDTDGLNSGGIMIRWQAFNKHPERGEGLIQKVELVKLSALDSVLPANIPRITPNQRKEQLKNREAAYHRRLAN